jgi:hypothetical protein
VSLEITLAAPFRHTRKDRLQKNDLIFYLVLDRKWMSREQATALLDRGIEKGLLSYAEGWITPRFDVSAVTIPLGYRPPATIFQEEDPVQELLQRIATRTNRPLTEVTAEANEILSEQFAGNLRIEAAVVLLAKKQKVPFEDLLEKLKEQVMKKE